MHVLFIKYIAFFRYDSLNEFSFDNVDPDMFNDIITRFGGNSYIIFVPYHIEMLFVLQEFNVVFSMKKNGIRLLIDWSIRYNWMIIPFSRLGT